MTSKTSDRSGKIFGGIIALAVLVLALAWSNRDATKPEQHGPEQWAAWEDTGRRSVTTEQLFAACRRGDRGDCKACEAYRQRTGSTVVWPCR